MQFRLIENEMDETTALRSIFLKNKKEYGASMLEPSL